MDGSLIWIGALSFCGGWLIRGAFEPKVDPPACACHCSCNIPSESTGSFNWFVYTVLGVLLTVGVVLATNAVLAFRVTVKSPQGEQELAVQLKGKSKGVYGASRGFQLTGYNGLQSWRCVLC